MRNGNTASSKSVRLAEDTQRENEDDKSSNLRPLTVQSVREFDKQNSEPLDMMERIDTCDRDEIHVSKEYNLDMENEKYNNLLSGQEDPTDRDADKDDALVLTFSKEN